jgi:hypothetical protein
MAFFPILVEKVSDVCEGNKLRFVKCQSDATTAHVPSLLTSKYYCFPSTVIEKDDAGMRAIAI